MLDSEKPTSQDAGFKNMARVISLYMALLMFPVEHSQARTFPPLPTSPSSEIAKTFEGELNIKQQLREILKLRNKTPNQVQQVMSVYLEIEKHIHPYLLNILTPDIFFSKAALNITIKNLETDFEKTDFLRLTRTVQVVFNFLKNEVTSDRRNLSYMSTMVARNILEFESSAVHIDQNLVKEYWQHVLEFREKFGNLEILGPEVLVVAGSQKKQGQNIFFSPEAESMTVGKGVKLARVSEASSIQDLVDAKSAIGEAVSQISSGGTIIFDSHYYMGERQGHILLTNPDEYQKAKLSEKSYHTLTSDELISFFEQRYQDKVKLEMDKKNPLKIIFAGCDARVVKDFLVKWKRTFSGIDSSLPIVLAETEEGTPAFTKDPRNNSTMSRFMGFILKGTTFESLINDFTDFSTKYILYVPTDSNLLSSNKPLQIGLDGNPLKGSSEG